MIDKLCQYWIQAKQNKTHQISINNADIYSPFHPHIFASINTPSQPYFLRSYYSNDVGWNKISNIHKTYHCGTFPWSLCIENTTFHCVCVVTELHVTANYIKTLSFAQQCVMVNLCKKQCKIIHTSVWKKLHSTLFAHGLL